MQQQSFTPGMNIGMGLNLLTGDCLVQSVNGAVTAPAAAGQQVESRIVRIDDISSLYTSLGVDVSASGSYLGFSASAKTDFADSCGFNEHSIYLMASVTVTNAMTRMDAPALIPEAVQLLQNGKPDRFRDRFGDVFIAGILAGGEYFAVFQITGTDEEEKEKLSVSVNASFNGLIGSADLSADIQKQKQSSSSHLDMRVYTYQRGGADTSTDQDPTQVMAKARGFPPSLAGANAQYAVPYSVLTESYETLDLPSDAANLIDIENQKEMLAKNFAIRTQVMLLINNIDYVLFSQAEGYNEFEPFDVTALAAERASLAQSLDLINKQASACMRDPTQCVVATYTAPTLPLPKKRQQTIAFALDRDWQGGTASPQVQVNPGGNNFIARGRMKLSLPDNARIAKFDVTAQINAVSPSPQNYSEMHFQVERVAADGTAQIVIPDTRISTDPGQTVGFRVGQVEVACFPTPGMEMVDNGAFQYVVDAWFIVHNMGGPAPLVPAKAVVWQNIVISYG